MRIAYLIIAILAPTTLHASDETTTLEVANKEVSPESFIKAYYSKFIAITPDISRTAIKSPNNVRFYEISKLELIIYSYQKLTNADKLNGVDLKMAFSVKGTAFRFYDRNKDKTWSEWKSGSPAELNWLATTLTRKNGKYEVTKSTGLKYLTYWNSPS